MHHNGIKRERPWAHLIEIFYSEEQFMKIRGNKPYRSRYADANRIIQAYSLSS